MISRNDAIVTDFFEKISSQRWVIDVTKSKEYPIFDSSILFSIYAFRNQRGIIYLLYSTSGKIMTIFERRRKRGGTKATKEMIENWS